MWAHVARARAARAPQSQVFSCVLFEPLPIICNVGEYANSCI